MYALSDYVNGILCQHIMDRSFTDNRMSQTPKPKRNTEATDESVRSWRPKTETDDLVGREIVRFFHTTGRRPRILLGRSREDDRRGRVNEIAHRLSQYGFDVDISPARAAPGQLARMAMENDVHIACLLFNGEPAQEFSQVLKELSRDDILVIVCADDLTSGGKEGGPTGGGFDPGDAEGVLQLLKEVVSTCPEI